VAERTGRRAARDGAAVALLLLAAVGSVPLAQLDAGPEHGPALVLVWAIAGLQLLATPVVLAQRRWPIGVAALVAAVVVAGLVPLAVTSYPLVVRFSTVNLWPPLALSGAVIALRRHAPGRRAGGVWALVAVATVLAARPWQPSWSVTPVGLLHTAVPVLLGMYLAGRWQMLDALRERAEQSERERRLLADRARAEERAHLAAELHDSVAHRVSLMVLQAGALRLTSPDQPTRDAAEHLRATGCQALEELRDLLGVLRDPARPDPGDVPGAGRDDAVGKREGPVDVGLGELVEQSRAVGFPVTLDEVGDATSLSPVVRRTVYRIVQEALTNVHKYAPGAGVDVTARYGGDRVVVRIRNQAAEPPAAGIGLPVTGGGTGLLGLRRRVEAIGGALQAGPDDEGGFRLDATMPAQDPGREPDHATGLGGPR
jgi:signal transduction histidine kinase